jgi:hypothetical protein
VVKETRQLIRNIKSTLIRDCPHQSELITLRDEILSLPTMKNGGSIRDGPFYSRTQPIIMTGPIEAIPWQEVRDDIDACDGLLNEMLEFFESPGKAEHVATSTVHLIFWSRTKKELEKLLRALRKNGFISAGSHLGHHFAYARQRKRVPLGELTQSPFSMFIWEKSAKSCAVLFVELLKRGYVKVQRDPNKYGAKSDATILMEQVSAHFLWRNPRTRATQPLNPDSALRSRSNADNKDSQVLTVLREVGIQ